MREGGGESLTEMVMPSSPPRFTLRAIGSIHLPAVDGLREVGVLALDVEAVDVDLGLSISLGRFLMGSLRSMCGRWRSMPPLFIVYMRSTEHEVLRGNFGRAVA